MDVLDWCYELFIKILIFSLFNKCLKKYSVYHSANNSRTIINNFFFLKHCMSKYKKLSKIEKPCCSILFFITLVRTIYFFIWVIWLQKYFFYFLCIYWKLKFFDFWKEKSKRRRERESRMESENKRGALVHWRFLREHSLEGGKWHETALE